MIHTRTTIRLSVIADAENAVEALSSDEVPASKKEEYLSIIKLALNIFHHKIIRIQELEHQVAALRNCGGEKILIGDVELIQEIADLDRKILEYKNTILMMQELYDLPKTGTD